MTSSQLIVPKMEPDELELLKVLDVEPTPETRKDGTAPFMIEVHIGQRSSIAKMSGAVLCWESGRRLSGDGNELMFYCGYKDCQKSIRTAFFDRYHVECPHCHRTSFRSPVDRQYILQNKSLSDGQRRDLSKLPIIFDSMMFKDCSPTFVAKLVGREWRKLARNADIAAVFHKLDIRNYDVPLVQVGEHYGKARKARDNNMVVYPLARIFRDLGVPGVELETRLVTMLSGF